MRLFTNVRTRVAWRVAAFAESVPPGENWRPAEIDDRRDSPGSRGPTRHRHRRAGLWALLHAQSLLAGPAAADVLGDGVRDAMDPRTDRDVAAGAAGTRRP
ncbi:MAG: hypothetical protein ACRDRJ_04680 [Streptosporangiaceae bacterium]